MADDMITTVKETVKEYASKLFGRTPPAGEIGISEDSMFRKWHLHPYSPDRLIQRKGFAILEEMAKDDQIAQVLTARKTMLIAPGWELEPGDDTPAAQEQADFVTWALENIDGAFKDDLWEICGALEIGWSISEKVWKVCEDPKWNGKWTLEAIKSKNPRDYNLDRDEHDNLKPDGIVRITQPQVGQRFPSSKFIVYSYRKRYEDLFGTAVTRSLYDLWWIKHVLKRAMGVYFERAGTPIATAKYPAGMSETEQNKLFNLVKSIRFESAAVIPKEVELLFTESKGRSNESMLQAIEHIDKQIVKTVLGQTLTQDQGDRGSNALGKVHKDIAVLYAEELAQDVEIKVVRDQIIKDLIDYNFPNPIYPKFKFKPSAPEDETGRVTAFLSAVDKGAILVTEKDETEIRHALGFDERGPEDVLLVNPNAPKIDPATGEPLPPSAPGEPPTDPNPKGKDGGPAPDPVKPGGKPDPKKSGAAKLQEQLSRRVPAKPKSGPAARVDFAEALSIIEDVGVDDLMEDLAPLMNDAILDIMAQVERKKIIENKDTKAIETLTLKGLADMKAVLRDGLVRVARRGRKSANAELAAARKQVNLADPEDVSRFLPAEVEKYFVDRAFYITGVLRDQVLGLAKQSLFTSVKNGQDLREAIGGLKAVLEPYVKAGAVDPEVAGGARLETIVRTNVVDAFNMSRLETYKENGGFVKGLMYSAILDDRTREDHAAMDGRQYAITDPIWDRWTPPNGFNCRCVLIPVTLADGPFTPSKPPPASVQPDPGFKANGA